MVLVYFVLAIVYILMGAGTGKLFRHATETLAPASVILFWPAFLVALPFTKY